MAETGVTGRLRDITPYLIYLIFVSTLGSLQFGYRIAELNAPEDVLTCRKKAINHGMRIRASDDLAARGLFSSDLIPECIPMNNAAFATVSSVYTLGGLIGALCAGPLSSRRGRLPAMWATAWVYLVGAVIELISGSAVVLSAGRLISGIAAGASTVIVPLYISEIAPPEERGLFGVMTQVSICVGILASQTLGYFFSYGSSWRWILAVGLFVAAAQWVGLIWTPESPAWLAAHGDVAQAKRTLQRIRGKNYDIWDEVKLWEQDGDGVSEEDALLTRADAHSRPPSPGIRKGRVHHGFVQVVKDPLTRPAIVAVVGIMFVQQLCGINSIIMYSVSLLANLLPISSGLLTILISAANLIITVACSPLPDRLGRKTCLLVSIVGQGSSALALAFSIVFGAKILSAFAVLFFVGFFAVGLGPVPFMMASELVGQEAVGATQSWCLASNFVATFLVAQFFPIVNKALNEWLGGQGWVYFIFAALAAGSGLFVSVKVPETKGKKDADEVWRRTRHTD